MSIQLVVFDVDGLLLNTESIAQEAWQVIGEKYGIMDFGSKTFLKVVCVQDPEATNIVCKDLEDREDALQILHESRAYARELLEYKVDVKLGVLEILQFLKQNHIKIAVATSTPKSLTIKRLRYLGLVDYFDAIFCGDDVKYRKPHPEIYLKAIKYFNVSPQDAIVIEDSPSGVEAAFRANIPCIMVPDLIKAGKKQEQQTKYIAKSLLDVIEYMKHVL